MSWLCLRAGCCVRARSAAARVQRANQPLSLGLRHHPRPVGASPTAAAPRMLLNHQTSPPSPGGDFLVLRAPARVPLNARDSGGNAHLGRCCLARGIVQSQTALQPLPQLSARHCAARRPGGTPSLPPLPPSPPQRTSWGDAATPARVAVTLQERRGDASASAAAAADEPRRRRCHTHALPPPVRAAIRLPPRCPSSSHQVPPPSLLRTRPCPQT